MGMLKVAQAALLLLKTETPKKPGKSKIDSDGYLRGEKCSKCGSHKTVTERYKDGQGKVKLGVTACDDCGAS